MMTSLRDVFLQRAGGDGSRSTSDTSRPRASATAIRPVLDDGVWLTRLPVLVQPLRYPAPNAPRAMTTAPTTIIRTEMVV